MNPPPAVTVAIPVLNGVPLLSRTLAAVCAQRIDGQLEVLVADSGSTDGSRDIAECAGARVIDVRSGEFSHGGTRNLLTAEAEGTHVAFLTQDSTPTDDRWLSRLLDGFSLADDVGLVFGPYRPRPEASPMVRRELDAFFRFLAPDGLPRVDRAQDRGADQAAAQRRLFFTDANGCVSRRAWEQVPFREVAYAEDQLLARDMLSAGWAKAYHPGAAVIHSHDYRPGQLLRRSFDESRALREVHGAGHGGPIRAAMVVQREVRDDMSLLRREGLSRAGRMEVLPRSAIHHAARMTGSVLGSRSGRLPAGMRRRLSLEGRGGFDPQ